MKRSSILRLTLILIIGLKAFFSNLWSQTLPLPANIQSPNSTSLGRFGDTPVSYFTGSPVINIPLYSMEVKGTKLDLSLQYDAGGVLINQHPGWVGQNWSLFAGGAIIRTIQGLPDEFSLTGTGNGFNVMDQGFYYQKAALTDQSTNNESGMRNLLSNAWAGFDMIKDFEPDIFTFNFLGISGRFVLDNDGNWRVISEHNLKVIFEEEMISPLFESMPWDVRVGFSYPKVIGGFKIINEEGNCYTFGYDDSAIEYSLDFFRQVYDAEYWQANAWYLTSITNTFGDTLFTFNYERGDYIAQLFRNDYAKAYNLEGDGNVLPAPSCASTTLSIGIEGLNIEGYLISPVYLTMISSPLLPNAGIIFNSSNSIQARFNNADLSVKCNISEHRLHVFN